MQGNSDQNMELLDAGGLVGHPVPEGSLHSFLAEHGRRLFLTTCSPTFSRPPIESPWLIMISRSIPRPPLSRIRTRKPVQGIRLPLKSQQAPRQ